MIMTNQLKESEGAPVIFYDGMCNLCLFWVGFVLTHLLQLTGKKVRIWRVSPVFSVGVIFFGKKCSATKLKFLQNSSCIHASNVEQIVMEQGESHVCKNKKTR